MSVVHGVDSGVGLNDRGSISLTKTYVPTHNQVIQNCEHIKYMTRSKSNNTRVAYTASVNLPCDRT